MKDVVVNGIKQSLDLVALICYHKLKQKCQGQFQLHVHVIQELVGLYSCSTVENVGNYSLTQTPCLCS